MGRINAASVYRFGVDVSEVGTHDLTGLGATEPEVYQVVMGYDGAGNLSVTVTNTNNSNTTGVQNFAADLSGLNNATLGWSGDISGFQFTQSIPCPSDLRPRSR